MEVNNMDEKVELLVRDVLDGIEFYSLSDRNFILRELSLRLEQEADRCLYEDYGLLKDESDE